MGISNDLKVLQEMCFSIERKLPYSFNPTEDAEIIRLELFNIRCATSDARRHADMWDVEYKE